MSELILENLGNLSFLAKSKEAKGFIINNGYDSAGRDSAVAVVNIKGSDTAKLNSSVNKIVRSAGEDFKNVRIYVAISVVFEGKETPVFVGSRWITERNWYSRAITSKWSWKGAKSPFKWGFGQNRNISTISSLLDEWEADSYKAYIIFPDKKKVEIQRERRLNKAIDKNFETKVWDDEQTEPLFSGSLILKIVNKRLKKDSAHKKVAKGLVSQLEDAIEKSTSFFEWRKILDSLDKVMRKVEEINKSQKDLANIDPKKKYPFSEVKSILKTSKK